MPMTLSQVIKINSVLLSMLALIFVPGFGWAQSSEDAEELRLLLETGQYQEALDWVEEEPGEFPLLEARLFFEKGRGADAIEVLEKVIEKEGAGADLYSLLGEIKMSLGRYKGATENFEKALLIDPGNFEAMSKLGMLKINEGKRKEGEDLLRAVVDVYKKMPKSEAQGLSADKFVWFGKACEGLQRFRDAYEVMYDSALYLDPKSVSAHVASGQALFSKYNYPDSRSHFKDALSTNPKSAAALVGLARAIWTDYAYPGERGQEVTELLARSHAVWPDHPEALLLEGDIAFSSENWPQAEKYYRRVLAIQPQNEEAQGLLAAVYYATAKLDEFAALRDSVEASRPQPGLFYATLAERLVDRFFYRESAEFALKAMELDPGIPKSYAIFSINALRSGLEEKGREVLEEAWQKDRFNVWVKNTRTLMKHIDENFITREEDGLIIRMKSDEGPFLMPYLMPLMKDSRTALESDYGLEVLRPLTIEDFSSHSYFSARSIGLPGLAASGVCFGRLVTLTTPNALPGNWGAVAVHELAHVVTLQKAKHRIPRGFGEGLSVLEEGRTRPRWKRHEPLMVSSEFYAGTLRPIDALQGAFMSPKWPGEILVGYVQGGLICEMIVEKKGISAIREMLKAYSSGGATPSVIQNILGVSTREFDQQFKEWLAIRVQRAGVGPSFEGRHIDVLREKAEDDPEDARHWIWLASAYLSAKKIADAELVLGKAEKLQADHPDLAAVKALMQLNEGLKEKSIASLRQAIEGDSIWSWRCRLLLADQLRKRGETEEPLKLLTEATSQAPTATGSPVSSGSPWAQLATLQKDLDMEDAAIQSLQSQVLYNRDDAPTRLLLAKTLSKREDWSGVVEAAWDLPYISPYGDEGHALLSRAFLELQDWPNAKRELNLRLAMGEPVLGEIYPDLCWVLWKLGENSEALKIANRALLIDPASVRAQQVVDALGS